MTSAAVATGLVMQESPCCEVAAIDLRLHEISTFAAFLAAGPAWDLAVKSAAIPPSVSRSWVDPQVGVRVQRGLSGIAPVFREVPCRTVFV